MAQIIKETITTRENNSNPVVNPSDKREATGSQTLEYLVYFLFGVLEILLVFRLVLKVMGASISSDFVRLIYELSRVFILPFEGIFHRLFAQGVETTSVFEPSTLVAIIVYSVVAWGIVKLIQILSGEQQPSE